MRKINFYFFCLYNFIYKDGFYLEAYLKATGRGKILPENRVLIGLSFSTWLWTIALRLIILSFIQPSFLFIFYGIFEYCIPILIYGIYFYYYVNNNRFSSIYVEYKHTEKNIQRKGFRIVGIYLGLPIILIPLIVLLINKYTDVDLHQFIILIK